MALVLKLLFLHMQVMVFLPGLAFFIMALVL